MKNSEPSKDPSSLEDKVERCQQLIGYRFQDPTYVASALTHASVAASRKHSNERMEFLGDAILGMVVCEKIFQTYPEYLEGELTKIKSVVVSRRVCAKISKKLGIESCLHVGKGMMRHGMPRSLLSDVFEALIAAVYLDGGIEAAREFILKYMEPEIRMAAEGQSSGNFKSLLQQMAQGEMKGTPVYRLVGESGPDHSKYFEIAAEIAGRRFTSAWGRNKKEAEQRAAGNAISELRDEEPPFVSNRFVGQPKESHDND
ncbi:MAG: ribonuclease III [Planctomycetota bacterium]|jgi:ribonuclease-3